ncbi:MAG: hypothetical protein WCN98_16390, partial [Verrucomicrobiaceae bacterium]
MHERTYLTIRLKLAVRQRLEQFLQHFLNRLRVLWDHWLSTSTDEQLITLPQHASRELLHRVPRSNSASVALSACLRSQKRQHLLRRKLLTGSHHVRMPDVADPWAVKK